MVQKELSGHLLVALYLSILMDLQLQVLSLIIHMLELARFHFPVLLLRELRKTLLMEIRFSSNYLANFSSQTLDLFPTLMVGEQFPSSDRVKNPLVDPTKERVDYLDLHLDLRHMHVHLTLVLVQFILVSMILMGRQLKDQVDLVDLQEVDYLQAVLRNATLNQKESMYV